MPWERQYGAMGELQHGRNGNITACPILIRQENEKEAGKEDGIHRQKERRNLGD